jgi:hypothetical protein
VRVEITSRISDSNDQGEEVNPEDSVSLSGSKASSAKSHSSSESVRILAVKAVAKKKTLAMRAKGMKALQEIELQELQLKQNREALELNMMINVADAELKVCQGMQETGVIEDLDSIEKQNNGENAGKENVVHPSNLNASAAEWVPEANTQLHTVNNNKQDVIERNQLQMMEILQLPKVEVVAFDGDPLKYWTFIRSFENIVERASVDSASRLMRLIQ